jgi:sugar phosphate isomerase/epimerase
MRLGIGSSTYTWALGVPGHPVAEPLTALGLVQRAAEVGVGVVRFCDNLSLLRLDAEGLTRVVGFAEARGMELEIGTRGIGSESLLADLELARRVRARFVRVVVDGPDDEPTPEEAVRRLRPIVAEYAKAGVALALENHDRFPVRTLAGIVEALGREWVGIYLDTVNSFGALDGPEVVVDTLAPYALNLHVKDFTIRRVTSQMGFVIAGCAAGRGRLDVSWLMDRLWAAGCDVNAILELWTPWGESLEHTLACEERWARERVLCLRRLVPEGP